MKYAFDIPTRTAAENSSHTGVPTRTIAISKIAVTRHIAASEITMFSHGPRLSATAPPISISVMLGMLPAVSTRAARDAPSAVAVHPSAKLWIWLPINEIVIADSHHQQNAGTLGPA